jgi:uncharacterized phage protein (TIGR02218 family)
VSIGNEAEYLLQSQPGFTDHWFERGRATIMTGRAEGLLGLVKSDREISGGRQIALLVSFDLAPQVGDMIRLEAGCDKLASTCRSKFTNFLNFRGFPHVPGTDWIASYPVASQRNDGQSRHK